MWRPQERRQRRGAEPRGHGGEDEIERRGEGLGGERQRIAQLHGNAARREHVSGEIDVRQWSPDDDRRAIERNVRMQMMKRANPAHDVGQLVLAIAARETQRVAPGRHDEGRRLDRRGLRAGTRSSSSSGSRPCSRSSSPVASCPSVARISSDSRSGMRASRSKSADDRPLSRARPHQPQRSPSCTDVPAAFRRASSRRRCSSSRPDTATRRS